MNATDIPSIEEIRAKTVPILKRYGATRAGVFGSIVHGKARRGSDVDILVEISADLSLLVFARIIRELEEALGRGVDLVEYETIKPRIKQRILTEEIRIL